MKRKWWLVPVALALIGVLWIFASDKAYLEPLRAAIGLKPSSVERAKSKPICSSPINPNVAAPTDCIPAYLAKLPPDPGLAGKLTIEGIDSDKDGVRDDVQRYIAQRWGESERAVKALHLIAQSAQTRVQLADSVSQDEAYEISSKMGRLVDCYVRTVDPKVMQSRAIEAVSAEVTNTRERFERWLKFERLTMNRIYILSEFDASLSDLCGYDPASLPN
jgi:hypothetical protein